jgi:AcrR family transcriptional regulator
MNAFKKLLTASTPCPILILNTFKSMPPAKVTPKAEETGSRILASALALFRQEGFDTATMRAIAEKAQVATGAAYYYYPSKDAIVMDFYRRSCAEMQPQIEAALERVTSLEARLRELIGVKLAYFAPNRSVLRALLRNGADPKHPLSPFSPETKEIRDIDIAWFRRILVDCGMRIPRDLEHHLPGVLWFFQMGVIFFWVIDESPDQARTVRLLDLAAKSVASLIRVSGLPLMRPLRKTALQLIEIVKAETRP